jgi:hypothetical protein
MNISINPIGNPVITDARESSGGQEPTDYTRFENMTRKLVTTPKSEVDEQRSSD